MTDKSKIEDKNPFRVPDQYFEEVSREVFNRTTGTGGIKGKNRIIRFVKPALMLAAAMIAFVIISYTGLRLLFPEYEKTENNYTELFYQFNETDLIDVLIEQKPDYGIQSADPDEIIDYLLDNNIDYTAVMKFLY